MNSGRRKWIAGMVAGCCVLLLVASGCRHHRLRQGMPSHGDSPPEAGAGAGTEPYPRFHPVPTQPVFAPRDSETPFVAEAIASKARPASEPARATLPVPSPSASKRASESRSPAVDTTTSGGEFAVPNQLNMALTDSPSWLFLPNLPESTLRQMDRRVEVKADPQAKGQTAARR